MRIIPNPIAHRPMTFAAAAALALTILIPPTTPTAAAEWQGSIESKAGVPHVTNPATPMEAAVAVQLKEQWRRGEDESEEVIFALLDDVAIDESGNVYVLDSQMSEVQVFSPGGEYVRTIGRRGEGPGEFGMPRKIFITPDGRVAVVQSMPGKIVLLTPGGDAAGNHPLPEDDGMMVIQGARAAAGHVFLHIRTTAMGENQFFTDVERIVRLGADGSIDATLAEAKRVTDFSRLEFDEKALIPFPAWAADASGRAYVCDTFDDYRVSVWGANGELERVIERDFEPRVRSKEERDRRGPLIRVASGDGEMKTVVTKSKTDRSVLDMFPRDDGSLWVLSSRGAFDTREGELCTLDEFDAEGRFVRQIRLMGAGNLDTDGLVITGNRVFVLTDRASARVAMMGTESNSEDVDDASPMTLIVYELPAPARTQG